MENLSNKISVIDFKKLNNLLDSSEIPVFEGNNTSTPVLDFVSFRNKKQAKQARRAKAQAKALEMLLVIQGLTFDYEAQMLAIAAEIDPSEWAAKHEQSAQDQIREDMRRLHSFNEALRAAIETGAAATLAEACQAIRKGGDEELVATLEYILASDYVGFESIRAVLEAIELNDESYSFNVAALAELCSRLDSIGFSYCIQPLANLCETNAAVAI